MKEMPRRSDCPISFSLDIFGDKWTLLVIRDLIFEDKMYYGDFLGSKEKIATNILADRLQILDYAGIVRKTRDTTNKTKYVYSLTDKGIDLLPILIEIILWGAHYDPKTAVPKKFVAQAKSNRTKLIKQLRAALQRKKFYPS